MPNLLQGLLDGMLELVYPTRCAGCDLPGSVLCDACRDSLPLIDAWSACPRCGAPFGWLVCTECWDRELAFARGIALGSLEQPLSRIVTLYKDAGERRLATELAELLFGATKPWRGWPDLVTCVPATERARRRRGFDHALDISLGLAELLDVPHAQALSRERALDQRALGRNDRFANAAGTFRASSALAGNVLLVDDVLTTGATLDDAARALLAAGAAEVRVATIARAW